MKEKSIGLVSRQTVQELSESGMSFFEIERLARKGMGTETVRVAADDAETETAIFVVCGLEPAGFGAGDVLTSCHDCGQPVCHKIHAPKGPIKLCVPCARKRLRELDVPDRS